MRRLLLTENMKIKMADNYNDLKEANEKRNKIVEKKPNFLRRTWAKDKNGHVVQYDRLRLYEDRKDPKKSQLKCRQCKARNEK